MLDATDASIMGVSVAPAAVALVPTTACTYSGTNDALPNIAQPASTPCAQATADMRSRNRPSGSTGSGTRHSTTISRPSSSAAAPSAAQPSGSRMSPSPSSSATTPAVSSAAPA